MVVVKEKEMCSFTCVNLVLRCRFFFFASIVPFALFMVVICLIISL
jgi:hypothetical protein